MPSKVRFCCWHNFHLRFLLHIKQTRKNNSNKRKTISWDYLDLANNSGQHCFCFVFFYVFSFALSVPKQIERKHNKCCRQVEGTFTQQLIRQLNVERQTQKNFVLSLSKHVTACYWTWAACLAITKNARIWYEFIVATSKHISHSKIVGPASKSSSRHG